MNRNEAGFTLIELLTIISIIGILSALSISSIGQYRATAAYAVARTSLSDATTAIAASLTEPDAVYPAVTYDQMVQGPVRDSNAAMLLPAFQVSPNTRLWVYHDPSCADGSCTSDRLIVRHCKGLKYSYWVRYGDGLETVVENVAGASC